ALIQGYADKLDATLVTELASNDQESMLRIVHNDGREMAAIDLKAPGSTFGYSGLAEAKADIGMSARRARDRDVNLLNAAGMEDPRDTENEHVIGLDGLIVIVNAQNPIQSMSLEELGLVFAGIVTNWSQLGGPDAPINLHSRDEESGTFQSFGSLVLSPQNALLSPTAIQYGDNNALSDAVAGDTGGIGVTGIANQRAAKAIPIRQECGILSYPTSFAMKTEEYPLSRRLYLYTPRADMTAHARQIIEFSMSPEAQPLIQDAGFVGQAVEASPINNQGARIIHALTGEQEAPVGLLREMLSSLKTAERLSTTFRFTPGSSQLEPKSQADALRLAEDLAAGKYAGKEILLLGFTDSVGQFELNRALSARRADVVRQSMVASVAPGALDEVSLSVLGYGELAPVGCNTNLDGRSMNRRVEVWLRDPA
ncbi:MAG: phosphate ABC transporter substrate-binding/OmpA family protein, partial [Pseudomonadota bacterium]